MSILRFLLRWVFVFLIVTVVGQARVKGRSLENRYHSAVNSPGFQKNYWAAMRPATWAFEKVEFL
jgi:hypothetical protein